ncbi:MAG: twin-arginine translocation signal domain-containing protein [Sedimentisphaerales bacterium]|nr:twin-arginine translocation signal domain-containing protein [Sedimentisphaerales bacterium]
MSSGVNRRSFMKRSLVASAAGAMALNSAEGAGTDSSVTKVKISSKATLPQGKIGDLKVSRMLLGGNLLTHYTHSRDLRYVYNLTAHYNTEEKIHETMALAEEHGINTLSIHNPPGIVPMLKRYRYRYGGKMQWIICPTAPVEPGMKTYTEQVKDLVDNGTEAIYVWGVHSDRLVAEGKVDMIRQAVEIAKDHGVPSGVGAHDLRVVVECEKAGIDNDFYIKTFHHHNYATGPKPEQLKGPYSEIPGYWCKDPAETIEVMKKVTKPWIAFKVMAAGAIPPQDAFRYVFENGADHTLAGMFDFEIAEDVKILNEILGSVKNRSRPWRS